jgi:hypothetical protein
MRSSHLRLMVSGDSSSVVCRRDFARERGAWFLLQRRRALTSRLDFFWEPSEVGKGIRGYVCYWRE